MEADVVVVVVVLSVVVRLVDLGLVKEDLGFAVVVVATDVVAVLLTVVVLVFLSRLFHHFLR